MVRSGIDTDGILNAEDMIHFALTAEAGENVGDAVQITMDSYLDGVLQSFFLGLAQIDFEFSLFKASDLINPVLSFNPPTQSYSTFFGQDSLPGSLGTQVDNSAFKIGDEFMLYFKQEAFVSVNQNNQAASAFATQSTTDIVTMDLTATAAATASVPEPSILILMSIGLSGLGIVGLRNRRKK